MFLLFIGVVCIFASIKLTMSVQNGVITLPYVKDFDQMTVWWFFIIAMVFLFGIGLIMSVHGSLLFLGFL